MKWSPDWERWEGPGFALGPEMKVVPSRLSLRFEGVQSITPQFGSVTVRGMPVKVGIVGLPQVGKSTIFDLLTSGQGGPPPQSGKAEARMGVARVPDARLERLARIFQPKKVTPATVEYVDLPGLAPGEGSGQTPIRLAI